MKKQKKYLQIKSQFEEVISFYKPMAKKKQIEINMVLSDDIPVVKGEKQEINRLLYILIDNALKFSGPGGKIILKAEVISDIGQEKNTFLITTQNSPFTNKEWVEISVIDNGIGINSEELSRLFDRFYQVDSGLTKQFSGIGLGLSIAKEIVLFHNSYIKVSSKEQKGTNFSFGLESELIRD